jgi:hypothetical protein
MKNSLYRDFIFRVFWDPRTAEIDDFLKDYALRRYGAASAENMLAVVRKLAESVYSEGIGGGSIGGRMLHNAAIGDFNHYRRHRQGYAKRREYIKPLRQALEIAVGEEERQKGNLLYDIDLVEMGKQYVEELVNYYVYELYDAFRAGDEAEFEVAAGRITECMDVLSVILSSCDRYYLRMFAKRLEKRWLADGQDRVSEEIYTFYAPYSPNIGTVYEEALKYVKNFGSPSWGDYARRDYYELNKYCYQKRMDFMISELRRRIGFENKEIKYEDVFYPYYMVDFAAFRDNKDQVITDEEMYKGSTAEAIRQALDMTVGFGPEM